MMLKKLEIDALTADLRAVEKLLTERTEEDDPIGFLQFMDRKAELEAEIKEIGADFPRHAELGIFFGGQPVQGSRGINADFAGKAIDEIQGLISTRFSCIEAGPPKAKGPLVLSDQAQMIITNVMRGSFGFLLEEAGQTAEIVDTPLCEVVEDVSNILSRVGALDEATFEEVASDLDQRFLGKLKHFFQYLDDQAATMRIVNGSRDFLLDRYAVTRARNRIQDMEISEEVLKLVGNLYFLPASKRFDFMYEKDGAEAVIKGAVAPSFVKQINGEPEFGQTPIEVNKLSQTKWHVEIKMRQITERMREPRFVYSLVRLNSMVQ